MPEAVATRGAGPQAQKNAHRPQSPLGRCFSIENRYLPPLFITTILVVGQLSFGLLESLSRTLLAIATAILFELVLGRYAYGKFPHLASGASFIRFGPPNYLLENKVAAEAS